MDYIYSISNRDFICFDVVIILLYMLENRWDYLQNGNDLAGNLSKQDVGS